MGEKFLRPYMQVALSRLPVDRRIVLAPVVVGVAGSHAMTQLQEIRWLHNERGSG